MVLTCLRRCLKKCFVEGTAALRRIYSKRDKFEATTENLQTFGRICLVMLSFFVTWALLCMTLKVGSPESLSNVVSRVPMPERLSNVVSRVPMPESLSWMVTQRDLNPYILPDHDTHVLLPESNCSSGVFIAVIVCSSVSNFNPRRAIRNTWAQDATMLRNVLVYFLLGKSSHDSLNSLVASESQKHADIIQENFLDTYNNLTLKSVMLLKWVNKHCANAKYVVKTDDDVFLNLPNLFRLLKSEGHENMLLGHLVNDAAPVKNRNSKWFVPEYVFSEKVYPPYLLGQGYVMSGDIVPLLYKTALSTPFLHVEDVFITGLCARTTGLEPKHNEGFKRYKMENDPCSFQFLTVAHRVTSAELVKMWKDFQNPFIKCKKM